MAASNVAIVKHTPSTRLIYGVLLLFQYYVSKMAFVCVGDTVSCMSISRFNAPLSFERIHLEADHCRDGEDDAASMGK